MGGHQAALDPVSDWVNQWAQQGWTLHSLVPSGAGQMQLIAVLERERS